MNATARKMTKVIDELIVFFISAGSDGVCMDLEKQQDGYELSLELSLIHISADCRFLVIHGSFTSHKVLPDSIQFKQLLKKIVRILSNRW